LRFAGIVDFSGVDAPANKSRYDYIRSLIKNIMPSLSWKEEDLWMGQRPSTSDSLPVLGKSKSLENVYFAFGGQHVGLTIGPKLGKLVSDLILNKKTNINLDPYLQSRFNN
jgi:D-amino-acid dehydrogenase